MINSDTDEHSTARTRLCKQAIEYLFNPITYNNSINSTIKTPTWETLPPDNVFAQAHYQRVSANPQLRKQETQQFHPFIIQFQSKPTSTPLTTSNAHRGDSLDPRLGLIQLSSISSR